ncbi:uncharacterized protein LOC135703031 [Ochlerotatus camptorhynchus]|uniref:uncharacterized protein LOC135703031 n=1 Tax=Ochlerotatus camptorhynchus TaxID=644619 RepID=UPI0031D770F1
MNQLYMENDTSSTSSNALELVLDVYDDGTIQVASSTDDRLSIGTFNSTAKSISHVRSEPSVERIFECEEIKSQSRQREANILEVDSSDDESVGEPELVELCPCRYEECPRDCYGNRSRGEELVMLEANVLVKIPMKRRNLERLLQIATCCQEKIR